jgi:hypothetical protein
MRSREGGRLDEKQTPPIEPPHGEVLYLVVIFGSPQPLKAS